MKWNQTYAIVAVILLATEIFIALFVRDRFIRPYVGDALVIALLYCSVRAVFPHRFPHLLAWVLLLAVIQEGLQYYQLVERLGLSHSRFFRILLGTTFDWADLFCYGVGALAVFVIELLIKRRTGRKRMEEVT